MLDVENDELMVEFKGIYSVEKFIMARRFMYWQVYLHKTGIVAERVLVKILQRARELMRLGKELACSETLKAFLINEIDLERFNMEYLNSFSKLDDFDIVSALKLWMYDEDFILSYLCNSIINRRLPKIEMRNEPFEPGYVERIREEVAEKMKLNSEQTDYIVYHGTVENRAYNQDKGPIKILYKNGDQKDLIKATDSASIQALSMTVKKYYLCYPKKLL